MNGGEMSGMARTRKQVDRATTGALGGAPTEALAGVATEAFGAPTEALAGAETEALVVSALLILVLTSSFTILLLWMGADSAAVREG
jgi:hypothetical protein